MCLPSLLARVTHLVTRSDLLAGVAPWYGVTVAARTGSGRMTASCHLRTALVILDGKGDPLTASAPSITHFRARTVVGHPHDVQDRRSFENGGAARVRTSTGLPSAADIASSFALTLSRLRLALDQHAPSESDAEHDLLPLSFPARRRMSRPQLSMTAAPTTKQPSPIHGMVLPCPDAD